MENKIEADVKSNKNCNINVTNIIVDKDDELAKYNLFDEKIDEKKKVEKAFNDRINYAEKTYTQQLPKELQEDFEIKSEKMGNDIEFITKAKTDVAYKKFPLKINFSCKLDNVKGLGNFDYSNLPAVLQELYQKQKTLIIEEPYNVKKYIGEFEDPASGFPSQDEIVSSKIYIQPQPFPKALSYNIRLYNEHFEFEFENVLLRIKKIDNGIYTLSNYESIDDKFDVEFKLSLNNKPPLNFNMHLSLKEQYRTDCKSVCEFLKLRILLDDKRSKLMVKLLDSNHDLINSIDFGSKYFSKKEYKEFNENFNIFDKIIYIEKRKNLKFIYDENKLMENIQYISLLYNEMKGKNYKFKGISYWKLIGNEEIDIDELTKIRNNNDKITFVTSIKSFVIFNTIIELQKHNLYLEDCEIISIDKENDLYVIEVKSSKVNYKIEKNEKD